MGVGQAINPHVVDPDGEALPKLRTHIWYDRHNHAMPCILATWVPGIYFVWAIVTAEQLRTLAPMALASHLLPNLNGESSGARELAKVYRNYLGQRVSGWTWRLAYQISRSMNGETAIPLSVTPAAHKPGQAGPEGQTYLGTCLWYPVPQLANTSHFPSSMDIWDRLSKSNNSLLSR